MSVNLKTNVVTLTEPAAVSVESPVSAEVITIERAAPVARTDTFIVRLRASVRRFMQKMIPAILGATVLLLLWQIAASSSKGFPTPAQTGRRRR